MNALSSILVRERQSLWSTPMLVSLLLATVHGCDDSRRRPGMIRDIEVREAHALIQENAGNPSFVVLDVRTQNEFREGRLSGATLLDFHSSQFDSQLQQLDREKRYLVYCAAGGRSADVAKRMANLGFSNVYHMPVGLRGWVAANLDVETDETGPSPGQR